MPHREPVSLSGWVGRCLVVALVAQAGILLAMSWRKVPDSDEWETLYAAWAIFSGLVPYRDFYQIHTPLIYYFLAPLFLFFKNLNVFYAARFLLYLVLVANGFVLFHAGRRLFGRAAALFGALCYATSWPVLMKMTEVRPDDFVVLFTNLSLLSLLALRGSSAFLIAGVCAGFAVLAKQSAMFFFMAISLAFIFCGRSGIFAGRPMKGRDVLVFAGGIVCVAALYGGVLLASGAAPAFLNATVFNDFGRFALGQDVVLRHRFLPLHGKIFLQGSSPQLFVAAAAFVFLLYRRRAMSGHDRRSLIFLGVLLAGTAAGLRFIWHPWLQEYLLLAQPLALLAGYGCARLVEECAVSAAGTQRSFFYGAFIAFVIAALVIVPLSVFDTYYGHDEEMTFPLLTTMLAVTKPPKTCLSLENACPFRMSEYYYRGGPDISDNPVMLEKAECSWLEALKSGRVTAVAKLPTALSQRAVRLQRYLDESFVLEGDSIYVPRKKDIVGDSLL